ncbi:MAG: hypothetical protein ACI9ON_003261 [Limisphaerales bacterium]|jgi:hypothetical protein
MENVKLIPNFDGLQVLRDRKNALLRANQIDRILRRLLQTKDRNLDSQLIADLFAHWGDPLQAAGESYLRSCIAHTSVSSGHILQCGVGLSTLLLGIANARLNYVDNHLWALTDDPHNANVIRSWLSQYQVTNTHIVVCQPHIFDGYVWYGVNTKQLPQGFTLALSDGGRACVSGAVGLVYRMGEKLGTDSVILSRNLKKREDQAMVFDWAKSNQLNCVVVDKSSGFLKVTKAVTKNRKFRAKAAHASLELR